MRNFHLDTTAGGVPQGGRAAPEGWPPLLALLSDGRALPGPELARRLGISRSAVWKQVEQWRRAGLAILSGAGGYRLEAPLDPLDVDWIRRRLPAAVRRRLGALENHWQLDSTSSELARRVAELPDHSFVFADSQQAGRGRRGRQWLSPPATNLQFSCLKRFAGGYAALSGLSLVAGIAAAGALEDCGIPGIALKWPNDLTSGGAKLGGILVELGGEFMGPSHAIVGIGINCRVPESLRAGIDQPIADLAGLCGGHPPARNALAVALVTRLVEAFEAFDASGFPPFAQAWTARDALHGREVRVQAARDPFTGTAAGVDARGALQVRTAAGLRSVDSAEVSVRGA